MSTPSPGPPQPPSPPVPPVASATAPRSRVLAWHKAGLRAWGRLLSRLGADPAKTPNSEGRWPNMRQTLLWDLSPADVAPGNDGVVAPEPEHQEWLTWLEQLSPNDERRSPERLAEFAEAERRRHEQARDGAASAEGKASRLLTPCVGLLAGAVAFVSWQLHSIAQARTGAGITYLVVAATPGAIGIVCLISCIVRALDADIRVGIYRETGAAHLVSEDPLCLLRNEHEAAQLARWTASEKSTRVMYARAALTRALVSFSVALVFAAITILSQIGMNSASTATLIPSPRPTTALESPSSRQPPSPLPTSAR